MATVQTYMDINLQDNSGNTINKITLGQAAQVLLYLYSDNGPMVDTSVDVYVSLQGQSYQAKVATIVTGVNGTGIYQVPTSGVAAGTYLYQGVYGGATAGSTTFPPVDSMQDALVINAVPAVNTDVILYVSDNSGADLTTVVQGSPAHVHINLYVAGTAYTWVPNVPMTLDVTLPDGTLRTVDITLDSTGHGEYDLDTASMAVGAYGFQAFFAGTSGYNQTWSGTYGLAVTSGGQGGGCTATCINDIQWNCVNGVLTKTTSPCVPTPPVTNDNTILWVGAGALVLIGGALIVSSAMGKKK